MVCKGIGTADGGHCCWVHGEVCDFLIENHEGRRFACGLRAELGSWEKVHADPRYAPMAIVFEDEGLCGDWQPQAGVCCNEVR
jgi:hypothetical protein